MRNKTTILIVTILTIIHLPISLLINADTDETQAFHISTSDRSVNDITYINIKSLMEFDYITVQLPENVTYLEQNIDHDERKGIKIVEIDNQQLEIHWHEQAKQEVVLGLGHLTKGPHTIIIQGYLDDQKPVKEVYNFMSEHIEESTEIKNSNKDNEKNNNNDEDSEIIEEPKENNNLENEPHDLKLKENNSDEETTSMAEEEDHKKADQTFKQNQTDKSLNPKKNLIKSPSNRIKDNHGLGLIPATTTSDENGDLNTYFGIHSIFEDALSGTDADFRITLKLTGSKRTYKNVTMNIQLPEVDYVSFDDSAENLSLLAIAGVEPTFNAGTNELIYHFTELKRGQMYETILSLQTENGYITDGTPIEVSGTLAGEIHFTDRDEREAAEPVDIVSFELADEEEMEVKAYGVVNVAKSRVETEDGSFKYENNSVVGRGDQVRWLVEIEIPKKDRGQLFLNPHKKIVVTDTLPTGLQYVEAVDQPETIDGQIITWEFSPDDFTTRASATDTLFTKNIEILTEVTSNASYDTLTNEVAVTATFIGDEEDFNSHATSGIRVAKSNPGSGTMEGSVLVPNHRGPDPTSSN